MKEKQTYSLALNSSDNMFPSVLKKVKAFNIDHVMDLLCEDIMFIPNNGWIVRNDNTMKIEVRSSMFKK